MKTTVKTAYILFSIGLLMYVSLPNPQFPTPPKDSLQSNEPADTETPLRRAYFTNLSREEVMTHYKNQLSRSALANLPVPTYRLNYPPEEAQTVIRDQTRSTFLEEIVHPFRESVFVNGFEPKDEKDAIFIQQKPWRQKIIVRYVPSKLHARVVVILAALIVGWAVLNKWSRLFSEFKVFFKSKHND